LQLLKINKRSPQTR